MNFRVVFFGLSLVFVSGAALGQNKYRKATEGRDVVKSKIYPKNKKIELNLPNAGLIMNQSYINTFLLSGGANYFFSETWGVGIDIGIGINSDKDERTCIENFYYDPEEEVGAACGDAGALTGADANGNTFPRMGPAYVPIREINNMVMANLTWTPVYGKQLVFLSNTSYFDLFVEMGLGIANSTFYQKRDVLANGNSPRDVFTPEDEGTPEQQAQARERNNQIGATVAQTGSYGIDGRPTAADETNVLLNFGVGQKFHFAGRFHIKVYLRNMTLVGTEQGFDNLLAVMAGAGMRL